MIQPKDLYRKLAALLANIDERRTKDDFLFSVLTKLENSIGKDLHIGNGRLYVEDLDRFLLVEPPNRQEPTDSEDITVLDAEIAQQVIINKSYIFDDLSLPINMLHLWSATRTRDGFSSFPSKVVGCGKK
jgi:hypothetical protein